MMRYLVIVVALGVLLCQGVVHGVWTGRWTDQDTPELWFQKLDDVPVSLPNWRSEELKVDAKQIAKSQVTGAFARRYIHRLTGDQVSILIVCGRPGPVSVHTPDICYTGAGYVMGEIHKEKISSGKNEQAHEFATAIFEKQSAGMVDKLQIYWAWTTTGTWQSPSYARFYYGGQPALYKIYVIRELPATAKTATKGNPCVDLMHDLFPKLQETLFAAS